MHGQRGVLLVYFLAIWTYTLPPLPDAGPYPSAGVNLDVTSFGDAAVELRDRGGPVPQPLARPLRFVGGIGGYLLLSLLPGGWAALSWVFAAASLIVMLRTRRGRGLPGLLSGQDVVDAREGAETDAVPQEPAAK